MTQDLHALLGDLVIANRILAHEGVLDDFGHVAARHPQRPDRFFVSRSRSPELVSRDDLLEFTLDGVPVDPKGLRPYLESVLHARIFAARPDVQATVHHHCPAVLPFFGQHGLECVAEHGLGLRTPAEMFDVPPARWLDLLRDHVPDEAEAVLLSCTAIRVLEMVEEAEALLRRPVLTSNQATGWLLRRQLGVDAPLAGFGRLLSDSAAAT
jgi:hypothetical protein